MGYVQFDLITERSKKKKKPQMAQFFKFKLVFALKLNFIGGQFCREMSNFGYFNSSKITKVAKVEYLRRKVN